MTVVALHHTGYDESRHGEQAFDVGVNHLIPVVEAALIFLFQATRQPGVVDQHVDVAPAFGYAPHGLLCGLAVANVEAELQRCSTLCLNHFGYLTKFIFVSAGDDHVITALREAFGASLTDAARGTGDKNNLLFHSP